jgi:Predicted permeases
MLTIIFSLIPVFGIIILGAITERKGIFPPAMVVCLNQFVYRIGLPALLINQFSRFHPGMIPLHIVAGIALATLASYVLVQALYHLSSMNPKERVIYTCLSSFPNVAFMGFPVISLLFPGNDEAMLYAALTVAISNGILITADAQLEWYAQTGQKLSATLGLFCRAVCKNPIIVAAACGFTIGMLEIPIHRSIRVGITMLEASAAPCALFCVGMTLYTQLRSGNPFQKAVLVRQSWLHIFKLVIQPLVTYLILCAFGVSGLAAAVPSVLAAMPSAVASYVLAEKYRAFEKEAPLAVIANLLLSSLTIPLVLYGMRLYGIF